LLDQLDKVRSVELERHRIRVTGVVVWKMVLSLEHSVVEVFFLGAIVREQIERFGIVRGKAVLLLY
jgi:hypothetical protein